VHVGAVPTCALTANGAPDVFSRFVDRWRR